MDRDHFIITVSCLVCHHFWEIVADCPLRRRGFAPALSDEEVITLEVCGEYLGFDKDEAIFDYFVAHYQAWFRQLKGRTSFVRQAANLWQVKAMIQQRLTVISGQASDAVQAIDTMPLPVCVYTRSQRDRCFKPDADYGYCAAKKLHDYGFKMGLRIARAGMIVHYPLLPARSHDLPLLDDLLEEFQGVVLADKGLIDGFRQLELAKKKAVELLTPAAQKHECTPSRPCRPLQQAQAQAGRNRRFSSDRTIQYRQHSCPRPVALPASTDSQGAFTHHLRLYEPTTRSPSAPSG